MKESQVFLEMMHDLLQMLDLSAEVFTVVPSYVTESTADVVETASNSNPYF